MRCAIIWDISRADWDQYYPSIRQSNFLQSGYYADAMFSENRQKSRRGLIKINDQDAGMVQLLETGLLWNAIHAIILDRGPLWFDGFGGAAHVQAFFQEIDKQFPKRFGRKRRIIPEIHDGQTIRKLLEQIGIERLPNPGYQTNWIDITRDEGALKSAMRKNWRGSLNKAERSGLTIEWDRNGKALSELLSRYAQDKKERGYNGPSQKLLHKIAGFAVQNGNCLIGRAGLEDNAVAYILIFCHGNSATYQVGWTSEEGRRTNANHLLLWQAINVLKNDGIHYFDLGGVNDETAKGIKEFKEGIGGETIQLVGHYI